MGWLVASLALGALFAVWALSRGRDRAFALLSIRRGRRITAPPLPYARRKALLTRKEGEFLQCLEAALDGQARVFAKVRLEDIVAIADAARGKEKLVARNRIVSRRVDFALCEAGSLGLLGAIDLEDGSPKTEREAKGEAFKDDCLRAAGLPLLRFDASKGFSAEDVARWLGKSGAPEIVSLVDTPETRPSAETPNAFGQFGSFLAHRRRIHCPDPRKIRLQPDSNSDDAEVKSDRESVARRAGEDPSLN